jgi:hypothetical protein
VKAEAEVGALASRAARQGVCRRRSWLDAAFGTLAIGGVRDTRVTIIETRAETGRAVTANDNMAGPDLRGSEFRAPTERADLDHRVRHDQGTGMGASRIHAQGNAARNSSAFVSRSDTASIPAEYTAMLPDLPDGEPPVGTAERRRTSLPSFECFPAAMDEDLRVFSQQARRLVFVPVERADVTGR